MALDKKPVIILGIEPRITVPVARSLQGIGVPVVAASIGQSDPTLHSRAIRRFVRLPHPQQSAGFMSAMASLIATTGADMLIPVTDAALEAICEHFDLLACSINVACPAPPIVNRVLNKGATLSAAAECGIPVPREYRVTRSSDLASLPTLNFPLVAKPRQKSSSEIFKVRYFHSEAKLRELLDSGALTDAILQEYCTGEGVGVEMLIHDDECIAAFQHRRLAEFPHTGGVAVEAVAEELDPHLRELSLRLLRSLRWEGVAMVEYRQDRSTNTAVLMEVNGRYWGTVSLPIQAGIDFPVYQWQIAHNEKLHLPGTYHVGMTWRWTAGSLKRWHGMLRSGKQTNTATSVKLMGPVSRKKDALWYGNDPLPPLWELARTIKNLMRADASALAKRLLPKQTVAALRQRESRKPKSSGVSVGENQ